MAAKAPDAAVITQICGWADEGEIERAGKEVESQLRGGRFSAEIFTIWLGFRFARDGLAALPALLRELEAQTEVSGRSGDAAQRAWARGLDWLAENLRVRLRFHAKFHDARWQQWSAQLSLPLDAELTDTLARLRDSGSSLQRFAESLELIYRKTFGALLDELRAAASAEELALPEAEPPRPVEPDESACAESEDTESREAPQTRPAVEAAGQVVQSAALEALRAKLAAFERLVAEQAWPVAAMVARDVEQELSAFDPVRYFPGVFSGYLRTLSEVGAELEQYMHPGGSLESQALERLYRADPRQFLALLPLREAPGA
ncbi:MAG TPA: type VI secretion system protein IglI family protein [Polyangiaceae bacterium]|nr:type VI secretion system protein IglI family protein [Polyangiaceae bacterium]